jgi:hypothetical protein
MIQRYRFLCWSLLGMSLLLGDSLASAAGAAAMIPEVTIWVTTLTAFFFTVGVMMVIAAGAYSLVELLAHHWIQGIVGMCVVLVMCAFLFLTIPRATAPGVALGATLDAESVEVLP